MNARELIKLLDGVYCENSFQDYNRMLTALREVCAERDRLRDELAAANQQIFDLTLKVNNPAWLPGI